jgi:hypothetical protein
MKRCAALTKGGGRCQRIASDGSGYCYSHDPAMAEERRRNAQRAGRAGGNGRPGGLSETAEAKRYIRAIISRVLEGQIERGDATAAFQGLNVLARFIELERKITEQEEILGRIEALEAEPEESASWGA